MKLVGLLILLAAVGGGLFLSCARIVTPGPRLAAEPEPDETGL